MNSTSQKVRFVCISDTHNHSPGEGFTLPKGDVLVHAGDLTNQGSFEELKKAVDWLQKADFRVKIVVAGNHDLSLDPEYTLEKKNGWSVMPDNTDDCRELIASTSGITYLQHSSVDVQLPGHETYLSIFGSPYSPDRSEQNWAFQYPGEKADDLWDAIPTDTDVLITHTPPAGHCDASQHWTEGGCPSLNKALSRVKPVLHLCGHCHEGRGAKIVRWGDSPDAIESVQTWEDASVGTKKQSLLDLTGPRGGRALDRGKETAIVNASVMAKSWGRGSKSFNKPIVVDVKF